MNPIKLIVGLGNVGTEYQHTRHNAGFWFVETIANKFDISLNFDKRFHGMVGRGRIHDCDVRLLLPSTLMNRSGQAVSPMAKFYQLSADSILVAHDELDIPTGSIKLKTSGGHGGHNGLRDIIPHIGSDFHRLRIGIGRPQSTHAVSNFVLSKPSTDEQISIERAIDAAIDALPNLLSGNIEKARNGINSFHLAN